MDLLSHFLRGLLVSLLLGLELLGLVLEHLTRGLTEAFLDSACHLLALLELQRCEEKE